MKDVTFYLPKYDATIAKHLEKVPKIASQKKLYSNTIELFPSRQVEPKTGYGYYLINVDGYSYLNCYLISDAIFSSNQRGFHFGSKFCVGRSSSAYGETSYYFNIEEYYDTSNLEHKLIRIQTSDLLSATGEGGGVFLIWGDKILYIYLEVLFWDPMSGRLFLMRIPRHILQE